MTGRNPLYRPTLTSWQPPPRCECAKLRCRLARVEAERDALRAALDAARRELGVASSEAHGCARLR